jgi:hypothetical protein
VLSTMHMAVGHSSCHTAVRLRPSREFLEKFKIIFFSNFSRNYFEKFQKFEKPDLKYFLNFDFIFHVFRVLCLNFSEFDYF